MIQDTFLGNIIRYEEPIISNDSYVEDKPEIDLACLEAQLEKQRDYFRYIISSEHIYKTARQYRVLPSEMFREAEVVEERFQGIIDARVALYIVIRNIRRNTPLCKGKTKKGLLCKKRIGKDEFKTGLCSRHRKNT